MLRNVMLMAALGACAAAQAADAYKWVDANGVVHFSDTQPAAELKAQKVHVSGSVSAAKAPGTEAAAATDQKSVDTSSAQGTVVAASDNQDAQKRCHQARTSLDLLQSKQPVGLDPGPGGKPVPLDDQARQRQIASMQVLIGMYCK